MKNVPNHKKVFLEKAQRIVSSLSPKMSLTMETRPADSRVLDEFTTLNYLKWNDLYRTETAFQTSVPLPSSAPDQRRHNLDFQPGEKQLIRDLRGCDEKPEIDVHGFQFFKQKTDLQPEQYYDAEAIRDVYLPEFVRMLREKIDGADHIFVYDWRLRAGQKESKVGRVLNYDDPLKTVGPTPQVHVDCTDAGVLRRIERHVGKDCWELMRGRVRMINMWRPLNGPIVDCPLAFCDNRSYSDDDLIPMDTIRPTFTAQGAAGQYRPGMKWFYMSNHMDDEPVLFKNFDTNHDVAKSTLHTAFTITDIPAGAKARESIECRAIVFTSTNGKQSTHYTIDEGK